MATKKPTSSTPEVKSSKRRVLKTAPTLREQVEQNANPTKASKKTLVGRVVKAPFRLIGSVIATIWRILAASFAGKAVVALWKGSLFIPIRFIVRILAKILLIQYFVASSKELQQVTWPNTRTTIRLTFAVVMFAIIFGLIVAGMDYVFEKLFREVIL